QNPVNVIIPGSEPSPQPPSLDKKSSNRPRQRENSDQGAETVPVSQQIVDPQKQPGNAQGKQANQAPPVHIMAFGNRLVVSSNDPDALILVQELVRLLTQTPAGEGDFQVVKLKNANAAEAAKVLDEAFNGPKPTNQQQRPQGGGGFPFFNQFAAQGAAPPA